MNVAIFPGDSLALEIRSTAVRDSQLLAQSPTGFCGTAGLDANDIDQVDDTAGVLHFILFACEDFNLHGHRGVGFLVVEGEISMPGHKTPYRSSADLPMTETWWTNVGNSWRGNTK